MSTKAKTAMIAFMASLLAGCASYPSCGKVLREGGECVLGEPKPDQFWAQRNPYRLVGWR